MDSGNSGSIPSSSGGEEEFDSSWGESSISSFFNPSPNFGSISTPNLPFLTRQNPNFFYDTVLARPQFNFPNSGGLNPPSSSTSQQAPAFPIQSPPSEPPRPDSDGHGGGGSKAASDHHHLSAMAKNPKKRTRASRRAPTTVLTTDTTNFRQMVQEFTGIPSSPFTGTSPYSRRLDLFSPAAAALRLGGGGLDTLGPLYSLRPQFPPSPPRPSSLLTSTMVDSVVPSTNILNPNMPTASTSNNNPNNTYPIPADHHHHLLTLPDLQLGGNPFGGFPRDDQEQDHPSAAGTVADNDGNLITRWKSRETVVNHDDGGVEENVATTAFDGNIDNRNRSSMHRHHQEQHQISGHTIT